MFATPVYAQASPLGGDAVNVLIPFVLIIVMAYFLILRPQQKRAKEHQDLSQGVTDWAERFGPHDTEAVQPFSDLMVPESRSAAQAQLPPPSPNVGPVPAAH